MPLGRRVDEDCTAAVLVKAHARPGHRLGGEGSRQDRWAQPGAGAVRAAPSPLELGRARVIYMFSDCVHGVEMEPTYTCSGHRPHTHTEVVSSSWRMRRAGECLSQGEQRSITIPTPPRSPTPSESFREGLVASSHNLDDGLGASTSDAATPFLFRRVQPWTMPQQPSPAQGS